MSSGLALFGRVLGVAVLFALLTVADVLLLGGQRFGLPASIVLLAGPVVWFTASRFRKTKSHATILIGGSVAVAAAILGTMVWKAVPARPSFIRAVLDSIEMPEGLKLESDQEFGDISCFDDCPSVSRTYRSDSLDGLAADRIVDALEEAGMSSVRKQAEHFITGRSSGWKPIRIQVTIDKRADEVQISGEGD